jgi:hypothetical protein
MTFWPRIRPREMCDPVDPRVMCPDRRAMAVSGSFWWDEKRGGYCSSEIVGPWNIPVLLDGCPACGGLLPGAKQRKAFENLLRSQDAAKPKLLPPPYSGPNPGCDATAHLEDEDGN